MPRLTEEQAFEEYKKVWRDKYWQDEVVDPKIRAALSVAQIIPVVPGPQTPSAAMDALSKPSLAGFFANRGATSGQAPESQLDIKKDKQNNSRPSGGKRS